MKIVVSTNGADLDAPASPMFGRCPTYVFVDTETADKDHPMEFEAVQNPAINAAGGAGIQAAQFVVERGAQAVVTGNMGPNAFNVLQAASVPVYLHKGGTVREVAEAYKAGQLPTAGEASTPAHAGMGMGRGRDMGRGAAVPSAPPAAAGSHKEEIAALKEMAGGLRKQLTDVVERLDRLEKGG